MKNKLHLVIIHGIGKTKAGYAAPFVKGLRKAFNRELQRILETTQTYDGDLFIKEIVWDDILAVSQAKLKEIFQEEFDARKRKSFFGIVRRISLFALAALIFSSVLKNPFFFLIMLPALLYYIPQTLYRLRTSFAAEFVSDIIGYRNEEAKAKIQQRILEEVERGASEEKAPLTFIAHSLGTVISSDFIYDRQRESGFFHPCFELNNFFTFGSPLALFSLQFGSEMFKKPIRLENARGRWINMFDKDDPIAYPLKSLNDAYDEVVFKDQEVNTGFFGVAHVRYWTDPQVHKIIAAKLALDWLRLHALVSEPELNKLSSGYDADLGLRR